MQRIIFGQVHPLPCYFQNPCMRCSMFEAFLGCCMLYCVFCFLSGQTGTLTGVSSYCLFFILDAPQQVTVNPNPAVVELGQSLTLTCQADGFPKPSYSWTFNGGAIGDSQNTLQLASAQVLNAGNYTCVATNTFGSAQETRLVNVRCKFSTMKNF